MSRFHTGRYASFNAATVTTSLAGDGGKTLCAKPSVSSGEGDRDDRQEITAVMLKPFPQRHGHMHHERCTRLFWEHYAAEIEQIVGMRGGWTRWRER